MGAVTGTSPTCDPKVQISFDGGTTWIDWYPDDLSTSTQATVAQITASTDTGVMFDRFAPRLKPGRNPRNIGAEASPDPKVRIVFTIAGTSPSFTFTEIWLVQINYDTN